MDRSVLFAAALICALLAGCTIVDGSAVVTGVQTAPISPSEGRVYRVPPPEFEEVAIVSARAGHDFKSDASLMNSVIERLKEEASALGANGVLLTGIDQRDTPSVSSSYGTATVYGSGTSASAYGNAVSVNRGDTYTKISALAIRVP